MSQCEGAQQAAPPMTVIAMTREMGTRGKDVATGIAEALNLEIVHHELVERHVAERLQTSESAVHRFLEGEASLWERWKIDSRRLSRFTAEEVFDRAIQGSVIIRGWGAAQLLRAVPHVICVRVCAPMQDRVTEMMRRLGISDEALVRREVERSDAAHARLIEARFGRDWMNPIGYDLVINTAFVPISVGVSLICQLASAIGQAEGAEMSARLKDKRVEVRIRSLIAEAPNVSAIGDSLKITVRDGAVILSGTVMNAAGMQSLIESIRSIEGVRTVTDDVEVLPAAYGVYGP